MKDLTAPWKWTLPEEDRAIYRSLATALRIPGVVAQLLHARGLDTEDAAKAFLNTQDAELGDPFEMTDMQRAVERVTLAREQGEHVRVLRRDRRRPVSKHVHHEGNVRKVHRTAVVDVAIQRCGYTKLVGPDVQCRSAYAWLFAEIKWR